MTIQISVLAETAKLLDEIEQDLNQLESAVENKQQQIKNLKTASAEAAGQIENLVKQLDKVLESDGTGNHNN